MASSSKFVCLVFLLNLLFTQIDARESQFFFSKVSPTTTATATINSNNKNAKETTAIPDQQPSFLPETQSYGLYGQGSSEIPTATNKIGSERYTTYSYIPNYKPADQTNQNQETYSNYPNTNTNYYNNHYNKNNNNGADVYEEQQESSGETSLEEAGYTTTSKENNYSFSQGTNGYSNTAGRQGMSDTRFLDNGKYFYDVKNENNYYPNDQVRARDPEGYYSTNGNSYEYNNSNRGRYQNQNDFPERQGEQYVP